MEFLNLSNFIKSGYKSNAFAPFVWFNALIDPTLLFFSSKFTDVIVQYSLIGVVILIIIFSAIMYLVMFIKDPKLLQSERYRLEDKKLDMIAQKGGTLIINPVNLTPLELSGEGKKIEVQ